MTLVDTHRYRVHFENRATSNVPAPDLMEVFRQATTTAKSVVPQPGSRFTVDDLIDWALEQDFEPDAADRIRREAWGETAPK